MNFNLAIAAALSAIAAIIHLGCIIFGSSWYRFFGAGEEMAVLSEQGSLVPILITSFITFVLSIWSAYALSGAGIIRKLPFLRTALILITAIIMIRGIGGFFFILNPGQNTFEFMFWSSAICVVYGLFYLIGLKQKWREL